MNESAAVCNLARLTLIASTTLCRNSTLELEHMNFIFGCFTRPSISQEIACFWLSAGSAY
jgi:hypothetical protein